MIDVLLGVAIGIVAGTLSGLFGVGGGIVMTPGIQLLLGTTPIVALATPLPAIVPTALTGAVTYARSGRSDLRAAAWMVAGGLGGAAGGAALTAVVETHLLLVVTAILLGWQAVGLLRQKVRAPTRRAAATSARLLAIGAAAGFVSGLLGIGGGLLMVPLLSGWLGMPLKVVLGTSLAAIVALVIPGTLVHAALDHIDWSVCVALVAGAVPGAFVGARIALGTKEPLLRMLVGLFLLFVALAYGTRETVALIA